MLIIGKIVFIILLIILILLLCILFVPIGYSILGVYEESERRAEVRFSWLLGLINGAVAYEKELTGKAKIFFVPVFDISSLLQKSKEQKKTEADTCEGKAGQAHQTNSTEQNEDMAHSEDNSPAAGENKATADDNKTIAEETKAIADDSKTIENEDKSAANDNNTTAGDNKTINEKQPGQEEKLAFRQKLQNLIERLQGWRTKALHIWGNASYYWELWNHKITQSFKDDLLQHLVKLWKVIKPKRCQGYLYFGDQSPDKTGYACAIAGILLPKLPKKYKLQFYPDFENQVLRGRLKLKGSVMIFPLLVLVIKVALDKRLKYLIRRVKAPIQKPKANA